jgi:hypothetical protein
MVNRFKTIPVAVAGLLLSAGAVLGFASMPDAASGGLDKATTASGHAVPVRAATVDAPPAVVPETTATDEDAAEEAGGPKAGTHGADVSAVATAEDTTPDTNHGADVSAVAKANAGQTIAGTHRPAEAGKPDDAGKPTDPGKPE